jgi:hypothetical protein
MGVPPMPGTGGAGGSAGEEPDGGGESSAEGDGDSADGDGNPGGDCGDTGALPGGVGGMGQAGECIGGGAAAASDSESESSASADGSGASGAGAEAGGASGAGAEGGIPGTGGAGGVGEFPTESAAERAERLGRELDQAVGGFDEVLMEEQQQISSVGRNTEGFGEGAAGGGGGISLGEQAAGSGGSITIANTGNMRESPIDGMSQEEIQERTPEDIAILVDDDIIARQLREAALAEEDPALRERLWEEYRKYEGI